VLPPAATNAAPRPPLILIGGGVRSGKSRFALARAARLGPRRAFVATAEALDAEMAERIRRHRRERGEDAGFRTVEEPLDLAGAVEASYGGADDVVVVDCLTLWVSNLLGRGAGAADLGAAFDQLAAVLERRRIPVVMVSNEVGMGLVPETPLGRVFRDQVGLLHQRLAATADELYAGLMGALVRLRPGPFTIMPAELGPPPPAEADVDDDGDGDGDGDGS
jgi:adenosylcobinamide kinase/adenosylcobinamide-phosphate guanylyltransferase